MGVSGTASDRRAVGQAQNIHSLTPPTPSLDCEAACGGISPRVLECQAPETGQFA
ncbi:hypothetical protein Y024_5286 [Burkholderia pseudomallei TSV44]|nr:hypothetical protein Y024_5286 [Burkholderia pseudomallei TSV44]